ncbi:MAG: DNA polymerase II large subunit [archaeon]
MDRYYEMIQKETDKAYGIAKKAREKNLDPSRHIDIPQAKDMAARVEGIVGPEGIAERIRELQKEGKSREKIEFQIIEDIINEEYGKYDSRAEKIGQAVRTALTIETEGITIAGTEGIGKFKIKKNTDGTEYLSVYYAGPIRAAGGTSAAKSVIFSDFARKKLGIDRYKATSKQIERYAEEVESYHENASRLQYHPSEDEVKKIAKNCPVCIDGGPTENIEVKANKNVEGIETNQLRGGMCLVLAEGIAQKKKKVLKTTQKHDLEWEWIEGIIEIKKKDTESREKDKQKEIKPITKFMANVVGGRPVFSYPMKKGGFRLRYGKSRNNGIAAQSIHPAAMVVLDEFPAIGTQIKVERPGKAASVTPCDTIEPPIVKLKNGDVIKVNSIKKANEIKDEIEEILFLGDILSTYGNFLENNHLLVPSGICEDWWKKILEKKSEEGINLKKEIEDPYNVSAERALEISKKYNVPLHPKYTYHYKDLKQREIIELWKWLEKHGDYSEYETFKGEKVLYLTIDNTDKKRLLEKICIPHKKEGETIKIKHGKILTETLGLNKGKDINKLARESESSIELINKLNCFPVYKKAPIYVGTRMGRPEKSKPRKMSPAPHGLIPIGEAGGNQRLINKAADQKTTKIEKAILYCPECKEELMSYKCPECGETAKLLRKCRKCGKMQEKEGKCEKCGGNTTTYHKKTVNIRKEFERAKAKIKKDKNGGKNRTIKATTTAKKLIPKKIKGVKGTSNKHHLFEPMEKAMIRAKHKVSVFMDGTVRFDAINVPLTHFRPEEIGTSVKKLQELGYKRDYKGKKFKRKDQILELKPNDILIPQNSTRYLTNVSKFVDETLEKYYDMDPYYEIEKKEDLIGKLAIGLAPHTSAGVIARIIGFSRARAGYAHPYFHCAKRRNCDGDEDAIMLLMDVLLNFSREYLPDRPGGSEDAPLVLSTRMNPSEIDDEVHAMETVNEYPLEFYEATQKMKDPRNIDMPTVEDKLDTNQKFSGQGFTHDTKQFDEGPRRSRYTTLKTMQEKVDNQMELGRKIRAVDEKDMATKLINLHFMKDIYGNLRAFGQQTFRCVDCNKKFRRVPLIGKCTECGGKILLTVHEKGIEKYLKISGEIATKYELSDYLKQRLDLVQQDLEQIFETKKSKQQSLADF